MPEIVRLLKQLVVMIHADTPCRVRSNESQAGNIGSSMPSGTADGMGMPVQELSVRHSCPLHRFVNFIVEFQ